MSTTSPSGDLSTPVHTPSGVVRSLVNNVSQRETHQGVTNHYITSEQIDPDEAIDVGDCLTNEECLVESHVTQRMKLSLSDDSNGEGSTAEEGIDSVPNYESTTTDNVIESVEPVDYIESNPRLSTVRHHTHHANGALISGRGNSQLPSPPSHRYENWSMVIQLDDGMKKSKSLYM